MNKGNNVLICIGFLMLIYFLFSGAIIEGITTYMKGSAGTLCDSGKHIASKTQCTEAVKSLDLPTKEQWTGNDEKLPPYCSISIGDQQQVQWNESTTGKGHDDSFPICKGETGPMTPEEADADLSKKARVYLRGIGDELKELGKLRNKKRRTPVNIHIDVGDAPGQGEMPISPTKTRPSLGSADIFENISDVNKAAPIVKPHGDDRHRKEGFFSFPPTLGFSGGFSGGFREGLIEGIGEPNKNDFGLQNQSKNNGDIRNVSQYDTKRENRRHQHSNPVSNNFPVSQEKIDQASLTNNSLNGKNCTEKDHRGCRWWGWDSEADKDKKKKEMEAQKYNSQLETNYKLELENWKLEEKAKKENYEKERQIWDEQQKKLKEEKEEKQEAEKQRKEEKQELAIKQQMVKDNFKFDMKEQMNKLAYKELDKPDDPNDPTTLSGKANLRYEKDLLNWWAAEQHSHAKGEPTDPNIKPPSMANLTEHTSDKVASLLADLQSQDWGATPGPARDTKPPNKLPKNYKPSKIAIHGDRHGDKASPTNPGVKTPLQAAPKAPAGPPAQAGQAPAPLIGKSAYASRPPEHKAPTQAVSQTNQQALTSQPAQAGQAPASLNQAEGTTQIDNTGFFRGWTGDGSKTAAQPKSRHGIKKIIYDRDQMISPKTQRELGLGVHDMKDTHKQIIQESKKSQTWYEWMFGGGKARPDHTHSTQ